MATAITLTMAAAIIYDSDHYPNEGSGRSMAAAVGFAEFLR